MIFKYLYFCFDEIKFIFCFLIRSYFVRKNMVLNVHLFSLSYVIEYLINLLHNMIYLGFLSLFYFHYSYEICLSHTILIFYGCVIFYILSTLSFALVPMLTICRGLLLTNLLFYLIILYNKYLLSPDISFM